MRNYAREYDDSKTSHDNVISFPISLTSSTTRTSIKSLLSEALVNPEIEARLKGIMEAAVLDAWMKTRLLDMERVDDPFDAIYISELRADQILLADVERIQRHSDIIDLSNSFSINDEWED